MSVTYGDKGTVGYGSTSVSPTYPSGITAGDLLVLSVATKPGATGIINAPTGWEIVDLSVGTTGSNAADTGPTRVAVFTKVATGSESGSLAVSITSGNSSWGQIQRVQSTTGLYNIIAAMGQDTSSGTGFSAGCTIPAGCMVSGDLVMAFLSKPTDAGTFSAEAFAATGVTFGSVTEDAELTTGTGNDSGGCIWHASVSSGTNSGTTITASATLSSASYGPVAVIIIKDSTPVDVDGIAAVSAVSATSAGTTLTLPIPTGHSEVFWLVSLMQLAGAVTPPSGWTLVDSGQTPDAGGEPNDLSYVYKSTNGSPGTSWAVSASPIGPDNIAGVITGYTAIPDSVTVSKAAGASSPSRTVTGNCVIMRVTTDWQAGRFPLVAPDSALLVRAQANVDDGGGEFITAAVAHETRTTGSGTVAAATWGGPGITSPYSFTVALYPPSGSTDGTLTATVATAAAAALTPTLTGERNASLDLTVASAVAAALVPTLTGSEVVNGTLNATTATATTEALTPTLSATRNAALELTVATAAAEALAVTFGSSASGALTAPAATATATALAVTFTTVRSGVLETGTATATASALEVVLSPVSVPDAPPAPTYGNIAGIIGLSREQAWRYEVWDRDGYTGHNLTGCTGGNLAWQKNQAIKGQGSLDVAQNADGPLLDVFIRPVLTLDDHEPQPYGLWVPSFPTKSFTSSSWTGTVALVSLEALLSYTSAASILNSNTDITVLIPEGTVITTWIGAALVAAGLTRFSIQASTKTENAPQSYMNGETLLQVINTELKRLGYTSLYSDMTGTVRADPYVLPGDRSESFSDVRPFDVDGNPIFLTAFDFTDNAPNVPNRVRAVGNPVGWLAGQTAVAVNNDPNSPYSVVNRGYIIEKVYTGVSALSQTEVQSYANQQLLNLSKDGRKAEIQFLHLPGAAINQVFHFNTPRAGEPMFATMDALSVDLSKTGGSSATLTAITAVQEEDVDA